MKKFFARIPNWVWLMIFVLLAAVQIYWLRNVVMGDAFIHFVFARGIAEGQPFFYNGQFSAGSTSPLWSILLAPFWQIFGLKIIWVVKILAGFFAALAIFLTFGVANKISRNRVAALITAGLLTTSFVLPYWAAKGMETPLFVCLVLAAFWIYLKILETRKTFWLEVLLGIILGFAILTRPEAWFLSLFLGLALLVQKKWRAILTIGLPAFLIFAPYYFWLFANTGSIFPSSMARILRARQWAHEFGGVYFTLEITKILLTKFLPLIPFFVFFFFSPFNPPLKWSVKFPIFAWLIFHAIFFSVIFPTTEGYRYILAALPFFYLIAVLGIFRLPKKWITPILVLGVLGSLAITGQQFFERRTAIANCEQPFLDQTRRETGEWIAENTGPNDLIAMKEIDQSAFYGGRRMLSLDGTLDTRAIEFVQSNDQLQFLKNEKPNYFILEEEMYREYPDWKNSNLLPLADNELKTGDTKTLDGVEFILLQKIKVGDPQSCPQFSQEYFWWIFEVKFAQ
ncbi:MAG: glycosyltransferase family 39 protein [Patescibacteria group bacterium]